jgi:hypothetical protein
VFHKVNKVTPLNKHTEVFYMAKTAAKAKTQTDTVDTTTETQSNVVPESINLSDLAVLLQVVDLATQRGAFRGAELSQVGALFDKLNAFLSYVQAQQQASNQETTEE